MSTATGGRDVAVQMVAEALDAGAIREAVHEARARGLGGQLVVHLLAYADTLGSMMVDVLRGGGMVAPQLLAEDQAYQQTHGLSGFLVVATDARDSADVIAGLSVGGDEAAVLGTYQAADAAGLVPVIVVAAGRIVGVMTDQACGCAACRRGRVPSAGDAERARRADRRRRAGR